MIPRSAISHSGRFSLTSTTRSPGSSPIAFSDLASAATWRAASRQLIELPLAAALGPQERRVALLLGAGQEHRHQVREMLELPGQDRLPIGARRNAAPDACLADCARFPDSAGGQYAQRPTRRSPHAYPPSAARARRHRLRRGAPADRVIGQPVAPAPHQAFVIAANPLAAEAGERNPQARRKRGRRGGRGPGDAVAGRAAKLAASAAAPSSTISTRATGKLTIYDGRETAPAQASAAMFLGADGKPLSFAAAVLSGRSTGVPGAVAALSAGAARAWQACRGTNLFGAAERTADRRLHRQPAPRAG